MDAVPPAQGGPNYDYFEALEKWPAAVDPQSAAKKYTSHPNLDTNDWIEFDLRKPVARSRGSDCDGLVWVRLAADVPQSGPARILSSACRASRTVT